jgi:hypothetical protein
LAGGADIFWVDGDRPSFPFEVAAGTEGSFIDIKRQRRANMPETLSTSVIQLVGAGAFGVIIGWYVYYINRYRKGDVQFSDLTTLVGILGGGVVLSIFKKETDLFGAYGIGLAIGFFGYFLTLLGMVRKSGNFNVDWFLDGRRKAPQPDEIIPPGTAETTHTMGIRATPTGPKG